MITFNGNIKIDTRLSTGSRAATYKRVSDEYDDGTTMETQEDKTIEYCQQLNYSLLPEHKIEDRITGVIYRERPGIQKLLAAARGKEFDVLIVYDMDRFSRDPVHQAIMIELLAEQGIRVECVLRKVEYSPEGKLQLYIMGYAAQLEHERIIERTTRGRMDRVKKRKILPGGAPRPLYGYKWNDPTPGMKTAYVINPEEAKTVQRIFEMVKQHVSIRVIANQLTQEGIPTPGGKSKWSPSTIHAILKNTFYIGKAAANRYQVIHVPGKPARNRERPEEEWVLLPDGTVPLIVDLETFEIAQQALKINKQRAARNNRFPKDQLLRGGLAYCGHCGRIMTVARRQERKRVRADYRCTSRQYPGVVIEKCMGGFIETHILDKIVWTYVSRIIRNPYLIEQALQAQVSSEQIIQDLHIIEDNLTKINRKIKSLTALLGADHQNLDLDEDTLSGIMEQLKALSDQKKSWEAQKEPSLQTKEKYEKSKESIEKFRRWCDEKRSKLDEPTYEFSYEEKREACEQLGIRAVVWRSDHDPRYEILSLPLHFVSTITSHSACTLADT